MGKTIFQVLKIFTVRFIREVGIYSSYVPHIPFALEIFSPWLNKLLENRAWKKEKDCGGGGDDDSVLVEHLSAKVSRIRWNSLYVSPLWVPPVERNKEDKLKRGRFPNVGNDNKIYPPTYQQRTLFLVFISFSPPRSRHLPLTTVKLMEAAISLLPCSKGERWVLCEGELKTVSIHLSPLFFSGIDPTRVQ